MATFPKLYQLSALHPKLVLFIALTLTLLSLWFSQKLHIESDFSSLLPTQTESLKNIHELKKYFGNSGFLYVTLEDTKVGTGKKNAESFTDQLLGRIEKMPHVSFVDYKKPVDFFKKRMWLYLDLADLQEMETRVDKGMQLEANGVNPMMGRWMSFADQADLPDLTFQDIIQKYEKRSGVQFQDNSAQQPGENPFSVLRIKLEQTKHNQETMEGLLFAIRRSETEIKKEKPQFSSVEVNFTGEYQTDLEQTSHAEKEIRKSSFFVVFLLILVLFLYFRDVSGMFLVGVPLLIGLLWTGGLVYLFLGHLNIITGFAGAILGGLGSDYGIYLLTRYYQERSLGKSFTEALDLTFSSGGTAKATYASMLTTVVSFLALLFSNFGMFVEFGLVGALGLVANYVAMITLIPACLSLKAAKVARSQDSRLPGVQEDSKAHRFIAFLCRPYFPRFVLFLFFLLCLFSSTTLKEKSKIYFEDGNMEDRNLPATQLYNKVSQMMQASLSPTLLMVNGKGNEEKLLEALQHKLKSAAPDTLVYNDVAGLSTFLPKDQNEKKEILVRLGEKYKQINLFWNKKKESFLESIQESLNVKSISREDIPPEIRRMFESPKDPDVFLIYLFPAFGRGNLENMTRYYEGVLNLKKEIAVPFIQADGSFIEHDIIQLIQKEAPRGLFLILFCLGGILLWSVRPWPHALAIFTCLVTSLILLSAVLTFMHIRLNILNIGVFPIILGTGVNCFIHLDHRLKELKDMDKTLKNYLSTILVCNLTTIIGFSALLIIPSEGLRSVGWVAVLGLSLITFVCAFVFPRFLVLKRVGTLR
ncbi:MAG: MMPL family transporter [Deltaproteobacteria bacterium]|nr:MMPL family transporter [Deltaproteobacteria bacterium]